MNPSILKKSPLPAYADYDRSKDNLKLINTYLVYIYKYIGNYKYFDEDDCQEFILYFHPVLKKAINNFNNRGIPFEHYLSFLLSRRVKTYLRNKLKNKELAEIEASLLESNRMPAYDIPFAPEELDAKIRKILAIEKNGIITNKAAGKRLLFYVAARANELSPENIEFISRITGFNNDWLCGRIAQLKRGMENKDRRINHYIERKNRLFCRVILLEKKLIRETDDGQKEIILRQLKKTKALFTAGLKKIERATTYPSHREIAAILGVPKGTVDTSLYRLKNIAESV